MPGVFSAFCDENTPGNIRVLLFLCYIRSALHRSDKRCQGSTRHGKQMVANVAEKEATETFHEMDAEINKLLRRIHLLEDLLQRNDIPVPELDD